MNEQVRKPRADQSSEMCRLSDIPFVFLSYDEPWADWNWRDLIAIVPNAKRVHGVKGLDACHKAAAAAVEGDWVVTVDADARVDPWMLNATFPKALLGDRFRLDWLSRNQVNGLWSGNGSLKLWPKRIINEMRTHEAAPAESPSIDHDVGNVVPGQTFQLTRPERGVFCDPARTAQHAFRSGYREAVFLFQLAQDEAERRNLESWRSSELARILAIWCSLGRHAINGLWMLYGARLGLLQHGLGELPDTRLINDYDWLNRLWAHQIAPQFGQPDKDGPWRWDWLEADARHLGTRINTELDFAIAEFERDQSQALFRADILSATPAASRHDAVGYIMMSNSPGTAGTARKLFEVARWLDHPSAYHNLGLSYVRGDETETSKLDAEWYFRAALALGNTFSGKHLEALRAEGIDEDMSRPARRACEYPVFRKTEIAEDTGSEFCFVVDDTIDVSGRMENHVPDPTMCSGDRVIGYSTACAVTARVIPTGIRFGKIKTFLDDPDCAPYVSLPICLGVRTAPKNKTQAKAFTKADKAFGGIEIVLGGAGRLGASGDTSAPLDDKQDAPTWTQHQSSCLQSMMPAIAPKADWLSAADRLDGEFAAAIRRTAASVWGRDA